MSTFPAEIVYVLCALTSGVVCSLLWLQFRATGFRLLFWSSLCFLGLTANNVFVFVDIVLLPDVDLSVVRTLPAVLGFGALLYGFIWETA